MGRKFVLGTVAKFATNWHPTASDPSDADGNYKATHAQLIGVFKNLTSFHRYEHVQTETACDLYDIFAL